MKSKLLNLGLILASLIGHLEWGKDNSMFLFQGEMEIVSKLFTDPASVIHPFTLLPLFGQILLIITLFQKQPGKALTLMGMGCIGILMVLIFVIGVLTLEMKILMSSLPFLVLSVMTVLHHVKRKRDA